MCKRIIHIYSLTLLLLWSHGAKGQISQGGEPYSKTMEAYLKTQPRETNNHYVPVISMPHVENNQLIAENAEINEVEIFKFATRFDCDIDIKDKAVKDTLSIGVLYRCAVESPSAYSLSVVFDNFFIPDGAKLFLYDESYKQLLGAFTSNNNKANKIFAIAPIFTQKVIIEYFEPFFADFHGELHLGQVYHGFIDISRQTNSIYDGTCEVDINCSEGANWQTEKHAVCRILFGGYLCSGALINNTNFDGTPYFLTANHCISTPETAAIGIFYFNYEYSSCGGYYITPTQTISGASLLAHSSYTDYSLLRLSEFPNATFSPYWAGWDRNIEHTYGGVGIHHPHGLPKKISTYSMRPKTTSCMYTNSTNFYMIDHWLETTHGHGVTEGGSSGSPLFNFNHRIIGQLYGGCNGHNSNCDNPENDYSNYGKLCLSWDQGISADSTLKRWLDPQGTDYMFIDGLNTCSDDAIIDLEIHQSILVDGVVTLYSREYIESAATLMSGSQVSYVANDYIKLRRSFKVNNGSNFRALISNSPCQVTAPISVLNWSDEMSDDFTLEFNVVNAKHYKIQIFSFAGDKILDREDSIDKDDLNVIIEIPQPLKDSSYLISMTFYNNTERISNTYLLPNPFIHKYSERKDIRDVYEDNNAASQNVDFVMFPNPSKDIIKLYIQTQNYTPFSVFVYDVMGEMVASYSYVNATTLQMNIGDLPQGDYIVQIVMGNQQMTKRFSKI